MKTLLENCRALITDKGVMRELNNACIGIDGRLISYIGETIPEDTSAYDLRKDMRGKLLVPGLVNAHCHAAMTVLRGAGSGLPLQNWLFDCIFPLENKLMEIPDGIRIGTELAILELLASGVTSFSDMYMQPETYADVILESGIKANICGVVRSLYPDETYAGSSRVKKSLELFDRFHGTGDGRLLVDFCMHAEYTCTDEIVRPYSEECLRRGGRMQLHLSETKAEHEECKQRHQGKTPAEYFLEMGTFDSPCAAAHCVWVEEQDIEIFHDKGVFPIHNPGSNMKLGSGFAPVPKLLQHGIPVALGTDGTASNNNLNMFEEMHLAALLHCGLQCNATAISPADVFAMATKNGALLQGRCDSGCLEVGKRADIAAIDLSAPHMHPAPDALSALCYQAQASDVCMTMVDGRILYENGEYYSMDVERIYADFDRILKLLHH